jgi:hypothetical protein
MSLPQPAPDRTERMTVDTAVGDHSSPYAQQQYSRCHRVGALTFQINDLLDRLEV